MARVWSIVVDFVSTHLDLSKYNLSNQFAHIRFELTAIVSFFSQRWNEIESTIANYRSQKIIVLSCPFCYSREETVPMLGKINECLFCREKIDISENEAWLHDSEWWKDWRITVTLDNQNYVCDECDSDSVYVMDEFPLPFLEADWACQNCGEYGEFGDGEEDGYGVCERCGSMYWRVENMMCCNSCIDSMD